MWSRSFVSASCGLGVLALSGSVAFAGYSPPPTHKMQPIRPRVIPDASWNAPRNMGLSHTFPSFNQLVDNQAGIAGLDPESAPLNGAPAGVYTGFSVSVQWSPIAGDAWSNEAIWALTDTGDLNTVSTFYADPGAAPNSAGNGNPVTLTWNGFMDQPYTSGNPLFMLMGQTFSGSSANWNNVSVTINDNVPVAPPSQSTVVGGSINSTLSAGEIKWYSFNYSGTGALDLNTTGSALSDPNASFPNDSEIGLYASNGALIDFNDDIDFNGGNFLSRLTFADGELPAGTYYLCVGGFNMEFGSAFDVTSTSGMAGSLVVNGLSIPEPASLGMLAMVGVFTGRRRRNNRH